MRGTLERKADSLSEQRFIPAYAGNMAEAHWPSLIRPVHPRVCGEHEKLRELAQNDTGSSPRMRGTSVGYPRRVRCARFIPAYAGNMGLLRHWTNAPPVHPRVCGEHSSICSVACSQFGSSPRMRGTFVPLIFVRLSRRFIPAYAGNILVILILVFLCAVHPRVCGEHLECYGMPHYQAGSSPRMRGTSIGIS